MKSLTTAFGHVFDRPFRMPPKAVILSLTFEYIYGNSPDTRAREVKGSSVSRDHAVYLHALARRWRIVFCAIFLFSSVLFCFLLLSSIYDSPLIRARKRSFTTGYRTLRRLSPFSRTISLHRRNDRNSIGFLRKRRCSSFVECTVKEKMRQTERERENHLRTTRSSPLKCFARPVQGRPLRRRLMKMSNSKIALRMYERSVYDTETSVLETRPLQRKNGEKGCTLPEGKANVGCAAEIVRVFE